jgi:hypothetical protein
MERGQGKPSPYETLKMFAKKTRIYDIALPGLGPAHSALPTKSGQVPGGATID